MTDITEYLTIHERENERLRAENGRLLADADDTKSLLNSLKESGERFSLALRGANDGLWDWDLETDTVYYSPRWKSMLGYEEDELKNHLSTWTSLVHSDDKDRALKKVRDYLDGRANSFEIELRMHHKEGHEVFVLSRAFLLNRKSDNKPIRLVGTHVDITERKKSEFFVEKNAEILEMIATGQPASAIYDTIALMYEGRNPGIRCSMLELHGNKLMHGGAPSLPKEYCDAVNGLENGPEIGSCGTSTYTGKQVLVENIETDPKWADIKGVALPHGMRCCWSEPIKNSSGKVLGAFGMYHNHPALPNEDELRDLENAAKLAGIIMERVHSEIELNKHKQKLEELVDERTAEVQEKSAQLKEALAREQELSKLQRQFVAMASHEFRTPLAIIDTTAQRMKSRANQNRLTPEGAAQRVEKIRDAVRRMTRLMESTLDAARLEEGKIKVEIKPCDICKVVRQVCARQQEIDQTHDISCDLTDLPETIQADTGSLEQVLTNLLSNAVKYAPDAPVIEVKACTEGDQVVISVRDHGIGIDQDELSRVGERFFRARTSTGIVGTGIGLNLAKTLVEMHEGSFSVESTNGEGSTFTISLPVAGPDQTDQADTKVA
jgi:PAS domain S-box-containing protein